jgi:hypothetical protein
LTSSCNGDISGIPFSRSLRAHLIKVFAMTLVALRVHRACLIAVAISLAVANVATAATIHYVNPTPPPVSHVRFGRRYRVRRGNRSVPDGISTLSEACRTRGSGLPTVTAMATGQAEIFTKP